VRPLYLGDFHPDLELQFVNRLRELDSHDCRRLLVVVPNRLLAVHLRRRAAVLGVPTLGLRPRALEDVIRELAAPALDEAGLKTLPGWAAPYLLGEILGGRRAGKRRAGVQRSLAATLRDLRDAGVGADDFFRVTRGRGVWAPRVVELAAHYRRFCETLQRRKLADQASSTAIAARRVRQGAVAASRVWLYGFYDGVARQRAFFEALMEDRDCEVFFPWGNEEAFVYARPLRDWFEARGFEPRTLCPRPASRAAVDWQSAPSPAAEAQEVLRWIRWRHDGSPMSVGILPRQDGDSELLRFAARRAGEPVHLLAAESWRRQPAGGALSALLDLAAGRLGFGSQREGEALSRAKVEELLASGALHPAITGEQAGAHPARWTQALRRRGVVAGLDGWQRLVVAYAAQPNLFQPAEAMEEEKDHALRRELVAIAGFVARLLEDTDLLSQDLRSWAKRAARLAEVLQRWLAPSAARAGLVQRCAALEELDGVLAPSWNHFRAALEEILDEPAAGGPRFGEAPTLAPLLSARGVTFDRLVLPALSEGSFPRQAREDPWLSDEERRRLGRELGGLELPLKEARARQEERLLFHLALGSARERVLLSWPRTGEGGRAVVPSSLLLDLARDILGREASYEDLGQGGDLAVRRAEAGDGMTLETPLSQLEADLSRVRTMARGAEDGGGAETLARLLAGYPRLGAALRAHGHRGGLAFADRLTEFDGWVGEDLAGRWLAGFEVPGGALRFSASALENYARCGFGFFLERVLRVESAAAPERSLELEPRTLGSLFHELLRDLFLGLAKERLLPLSSEALEVALRRVEPSLEALVRERPGLVGEGPPALWRAGRRRLVADLKAFLRAEADRTPEGWRPKEFELAFGSKSEVEIEAGGERLRLRGRIDRLDERARAIRVVDYKTGRLQKLGKAGDVLGGTRLQLPLYRLALLALRAERREVFGSYLGLDSRSGFARVEWRPDDFARAAAGVDAAVSGIVQGMRQGLFFQVERERFCDQACSFATLCGPGRKRLISGKSGDERVREAAAWREVRVAAEEETEAS
jgi:RecB family exonuclease